MAIEIPNPIVIPAQPPKTADKVYILTMNVNSNNGVFSPTTAYFSVAPFVSSTGEILRDQMQHINIPDVFVACEKNPVLAQALGAIYAAVDSLCKERGLFGMQPDPVTPTISSQPSSVSLNVGNTATFSVAANGNQLSYQWQKDSVNLTDDSRITGATSAQLSISNIDIGDNGNYTVVITNSAGTVTSDAATLTAEPIIVLPTIDSQPSNSSLTSGETANFSVAASGNQLSYQWQKDNVNLTDDSRITGSTTAQLSISNVSDLDNGNYTAIVTNSAGTVTSDIAMLTVA